MSNREAYIGTLIDKTTAEIEAIIRGGVGSGHFEHVGRPGEVGGSAPAGAILAPTTDRYTDPEVVRWVNAGLFVITKQETPFDLSQWELRKFWLAPDGSIYSFGPHNTHDDVAWQSLNEVWDRLPEPIQSEIDASNSWFPIFKKMGFIRGVYFIGERQYGTHGELVLSLGEHGLTRKQEETVGDMFAVMPEDTIDLRWSQWLDPPFGEEERPTRLSEGKDRRSFRTQFGMVERGGKGSGHHGHKGRQGEVGGSLPGRSSAAKKIVSREFNSILKKLPKAWRKGITLAYSREDFRSTHRPNSLEITVSEEDVLGLLQGHDLNNERVALKGYDVASDHVFNTPNAMTKHLSKQIVAHEIGHVLRDRMPPEDRDRLGKLAKRFGKHLESRVVNEYRGYFQDREDDYLRARLAERRLLSETSAEFLRIYLTDKGRFSKYPKTLREGIENIFNADPVVMRGGPGSGHHRHKGRQGEVGGSLPAGASAKKKAWIETAEKNMASLEAQPHELEYSAFFIAPSGKIYAEDETIERGHAMFGAHIGVAIRGLTGIDRDEVIKTLGADDPRMEFNDHITVMMEGLGFIRGFGALNGDELDVAAYGPPTTRQMRTIKDIWSTGDYRRLRWELDFGIQEPEWDGFGDLRKFNADVAVRRSIIKRGGPGSGHHGHEGREGEVGGSLPSGASRHKLGLTFEDWKKQPFDEELAALYADAIEEEYDLTPADKITQSTWIAPDGRMLATGSNHEATSEHAIAMVDKMDVDDFTITETQVIQSGLIRHTFWAYGQDMFVISSPESLTDAQKDAIRTIMETRVNERADVKIPSGRDTELVGAHLFVVEDTPPYLDPISRELDQVSGKDIMNLLRLNKNEWRTSPINDGMVVSTAPRILKSGELITETAPVERGGKGSGHHGHKGRPGEVGGSLPSGGAGGQDLSDHLKVPKSPLWEPINRAFAAIDSVHGIRPMRRLRVYRSKAERTRGTYWTQTAFDEMIPQKLGVVLRRPDDPEGETRALTFAHEIGHYLDHDLIGDRSYFTSENLVDMGATAGTGKLHLLSDNPDEARAVQRWWRAIKDSDAYKAMESYEPGIMHLSTAGDFVEGVNVGARNFYYTPEILRSWKQPAEYFARSYAQYIATRSGDAWMDNEVESELQITRVGGAPTQWEHDDFAPVAKAFDNIFESRGLLR